MFPLLEGIRVGKNCGWPQLSRFWTCGKVGKTRIAIPDSNCHSINWRTWKYHLCDPIYCLPITLSLDFQKCETQFNADINLKLVRKQVGNLKDELDDKKIVFILFLHVDNTHIFFCALGVYYFWNHPLGGLCCSKGPFLQGITELSFLFLFLLFLFLFFNCVLCSLFPRHKTALEKVYVIFGRCGSVGIREKQSLHRVLYYFD